MSQSVYPQTSSAFVNHLLKLDRDIATIIRDERTNTSEIYQMYLERLSLFEKSCILPLSEDDKSLLQSIKEDIYMEFKFYDLKANLKTHFNDIHSGLNDLEKHL